MRRFESRYDPFKLRTKLESLKTLEIVCHNIFGSSEVLQITVFWTDGIIIQSYSVSTIPRNEDIPALIEWVGTS